MIFGQLINKNTTTTKQKENIKFFARAGIETGISRTSDWSVTCPPPSQLIRTYRLKSSYLSVST